MKVKISKTKNDLYDVCLEQYKCGKLCRNVKDIMNYIFEKTCAYNEKEIDMYISENINDIEYQEIINFYKENNYYECK